MDTGSVLKAIMYTRLGRHRRPPAIVITKNGEDSQDASVGAMRLRQGLSHPCAC